jgi:hypothetical protein
VKSVRLNIWQYPMMTAALSAHSMNTWQQKKQQQTKKPKRRMTKMDLLAEKVFKLWSDFQERKPAIMTDTSLSSEGKKVALAKLISETQAQFLQLEQQVRAQAAELEAEIRKLESESQRPEKDAEQLASDQDARDRMLGRLSLANDARSFIDACADEAKKLPDIFLLSFAEIKKQALNIIPAPEKITFDPWSGDDAPAQTESIKAHAKLIGELDSMHEAATAAAVTPEQVKSRAKIDACTETLADYRGTLGLLRQFEQRVEMPAESWSEPVSV